MTITYPYGSNITCCPNPSPGCCEEAKEILTVTYLDEVISTLNITTEGQKDIVLDKSIFDKCGMYKISHTVTNCCGESIKEDLIEIVDYPAKVSIQLSDDLCCIEGCYIVGQTITLYPLISTTAITNSTRKYSWEVYQECNLILDTGITTGPLPFTFQDTGKYKFVLKYVNQCGCISKDEISISVNAPIRLNKVDCFTWNITNCRKEAFSWELFKIGETGLELSTTGTNTNVTVVNGIYLLKVVDYTSTFYFPIFEMCGILECLEELALCSDGCNLQIETIYVYLQSLISEYNAYSNEWNGESYNYDLLYKIANLHTQLNESCKKCRQSSKCKK